jgi:hypothetical protein
MRDTRPLHLIVIDGWHPGLLQREWPRLPTFRFLAEAGQLALDAVSTFPTVTPTALTTLVTGEAPSRHGIRGIMWYHREDDRYVHYWPSPQSLMGGTLPQVLRDIVVNLNGAHLQSVPTLFERLEGAGLVCGSVNFPVCRGPHLHPGRLPWLLARTAGLPRDLAVRGPRHCYSGDLLRPPGFRPQGLLSRYGINDRRAIAFARHLIAREQADFTLIYLNEHDMRSHHAGPMECGYSLRLLDRALSRLLNSYGSWEAAVTRARWILVGDHAQSRVGGFPGYAVDAFQALADLRVPSLAQGGLYRDGHDLAIAPNDRSALLYLRDQGGRADLVARLARWPSVDQIAWKEGDRVVVQKDVGRLSYSPGGPWRDDYGQTWSLEGDWSVLDLRPLGPGQLGYGGYPDALERLADALLGADAVITARAGYEFTAGMTMGKGNHGSLAEEDSLVPLLSVGVPLPPGPLRTRDVAPAILRAFGLAAPPTSTRSLPCPSSVTG